MPEVAVVIPVRNQAHFLAQALQSVLDQSPPVMEIVVVDDASRDGVDAVLSTFDDARIRMIRSDAPVGPTAARNLGIADTSAPVLAFLDADDAFRPGWLDYAVRALEAEPAAGAIHGSIETHRGSQRVLERNPDRIMTGEELKVALFRHVLPITNSAVVAWRSTLDGIGNYDPRFIRHQDRDLLLRLADAGGVIWCSRIAVDKRQHAGSMSRLARGYISGLDLLVGQHPEFRRPQHGSILAYLVARVFLRALLTGDWGGLRAEGKALREAAHLPTGLRALLSGYIRGRRVRRQARRALMDQ